MITALPCTLVVRLPMDVEKKNWVEAYYWGTIAASGETESSLLDDSKKLIRRAVRRIDDEDLPGVEARIQAWKSEQDQKWETFLAK